MTLTQSQEDIIEELKNFNKDKKTNFIYLKHSVLEYIFKLNITTSSKLLLVYLIKSMRLDLKHMYIITPYEKLVKDLGLSKPTLIKCFKELETKNLITFYSGTNKKLNTEIKEFIFEKEQFKLYTPNQQNIVELTTFYKTYFEQSKKN